MNNILVLYERYEPTNAELYKLLSIAESKGILRLKKVECIKIQAMDIDWCDMIISVRSTSDMEWRLAKYTKKLGKYWILLLDDDFLSLDGSYGKDGQGYSNARKRGLKKMLFQTDCLLAVNKLLAEKYIKIGNIKRYALTNTSFDCSKFTLPVQSYEKTKLVFYVNDGTREMCDRYILPLIPKLIEQYADKVAIYFLAVSPDMHEYESKLEIHYIPHMPFEEFLDYIANIHFDIGLAPLDEKGFSKYKYFNKYVEYTRAGIAGIYTDCPLYRQVIRSGFNGILCKNSVESWMEALSRLIDIPEERIRIAENAQQYAIDNFSTDKILEKLLNDLPEVGNYQAPKTVASTAKVFHIKVCYWIFRIRGWFFTAYSCIKTGNIKAIFKIIYSKLSSIMRCA